jgi:tRNA dimethylallyltransferase
MKQKTLIVIVGATAVGKTDISIKLAQYFDTEIISADARQWYKEITIGTAKPTQNEMKGVIHHLVDCFEIEKPYNIGDFEKDGLEILADVFSRKDVAILAGGSGLYVRALCEGIDEMPEILPHLRQELNENFEKNGLSDLLLQLKNIDESYYNQVDKANPQRIIRALEVCLSTGKSFTFFRKNTTIKRPFNIIKIGLSRPREELYKRIDERMDIMLAQGLLQEATYLYPKKHLNALQTVGYREIFDFLEEKYDWDECLRLLKRNSRHYAKRQFTWFQKDTQIKWFPVEQLEEIKTYIQNTKNLQEIL